jgi:putative protein kinase ArgK-like GTPase of G3E family
VLTKIDVCEKNELTKSLRSVFDQITAKRQSASMPYVHTVSSMTREGLQGLKQSIAEIVSYEPDNACEEVMPISMVDEKDMMTLVEDDEQEVMMSEHDLKVFKALEANMKEEERYRDDRHR